MTGSLARLAGTQAIMVGNVLGGRTVGGRAALLHVRGTSLNGMVTKAGRADFVGLRVLPWVRRRLHGRADACGLMNGVAARGRVVRVTKGLIRLLHVSNP